MSSQTISDVFARFCYYSYMRFKETKKRSITKSVTFRITVIVSDLIVIYMVTGHVETTIALTIFTNLASTILYFSHERIWNAIEWGRRRIR